MPKIDVEKLSKKDLAKLKKDLAKLEAGKQERPVAEDWADYEVAVRKARKVATEIDLLSRRIARKQWAQRVPLGWEPSPPGCGGWRYGGGPGGGGWGYGGGPGGGGWGYGGGPGGGGWGYGGGPGGGGWGYGGGPGGGGWGYGGG